MNDRVKNKILTKMVLRKQRNTMPFSRRQYKMIKKMLPMERLYSQTGWSGQTVSDAGQTLSLVPNNTTRDGNQINVASIYGRYQIVGVDAFNYMRVIIFRWKPDTTPSVSSVLDATAVSNNLAATALYNVENAGNYVILYDRTHIQDSTNYPASKLFTYNLKKKVKKLHNGSKVIYDGTSSTATVGQYKFYAVAVSDSLAISHPYINLYNRVAYTDA